MLKRLWRVRRSQAPSSNSTTSYPSTVSLLSPLSLYSERSPVTPFSPAALQAASGKWKFGIGRDDDTWDDDEGHGVELA